MNIAELATQPVVVVQAADPCRRAVDLMEQHALRHLPVVDGKRPMGMLSERDLLFHLYWLGSEGGAETIHSFVATESTQVGEIVSTPLTAVPPDAPVSEVARLMLDNGISAVPLVRKNRLAGVITETDLLRCFAREECELGLDKRHEPVDNHMTDAVVSVEPKKPTVAALRLMGEQHIRHLPVLDGEGRLVGVVSDRDIFRGCAKEDIDDSQIGERFQRNQENLVENVMARHLVVANLTTPLAQAAEKMAAEKVGVLPIMHRSSLVGLISETDVLRAVVA